MQNNVIQQFKQLAQQTPEVDALSLYGSRARGQAHEQSDYDLAILFKGYISGFR